MKIGQLAAIAGTQSETVRYYEREGLLPPPRRSGGNYRLYDDMHVQRLSFIRHCRALDMNLEEIRALLSFKDAPAENCTAVNSLLDAHIDHVGDRMRELRKLDRELRALRDQCNVVQTGERCGILNELSSATRNPAVRTASHVTQVHGTPRGGRKRLGETA